MEGRYDMSDIILKMKIALPVIIAIILVILFYTRQIFLKDLIGIAIGAIVLIMIGIIIKICSDLPKRSKIFLILLLCGAIGLLGYMLSLISKL